MLLPALVGWLACLPVDGRCAGSGAAPAVDGGVRFAVIGDYGKSGPAEAAVAALVAGWAPDFVVTTGDNNYPDGEAETLQRNVAEPWAAFLGAPPRRFFPTLGNHDWTTDRARPYLDFFHLPGNERYYAVRRGPVQILVVDSDRREPDGVTPESVQGQWLRAALARSDACFKLVVFHHPPYSSGPHGPSEYMRWPFRAWGADAVLSGHDHVYERLRVAGFLYFVNGLGGGKRYPFEAPVSGSQVRFRDQFGAMRVEARPGRMTLEFWTVDGERIDRTELDKTCDVRGARD